MKITAVCTLALVASASAFAPASTVSVSMNVSGGEIEMTTVLGIVTTKNGVEAAHK